jgi:hypothetical protein
VCAANGLVPGGRHQALFRRRPEQLAGWRAIGRLVRPPPGQREPSRGRGGRGFFQETALPDSWLSFDEQYPGPPCLGGPNQIERNSQFPISAAHLSASEELGRHSATLWLLAERQSRAVVASPGTARAIVESRKNQCNHQVRRKTRQLPAFWGTDFLGGLGRKSFGKSQVMYFLGWP